MRREQLLNRTQAVLDGDINDTVTTVAVVDGSVYPSEGDWRISIDNEIMLVTARSTNNLTVVRGVDGTTAAAHTSGTTLYAIITEAGLAQYAKDNLNLVDFSLGHTSWSNRGRLLDQSGNVLTQSDFTGVNMGASTITDHAWGGISVELPTVSTNQHRMLVRSQPTTPYTLIANTVCSAPVDAGFNWASVLFRESSTGRILAPSVRPHDTIRLERWTSPSAFSTQLGATLDWGDAHDIWWKLTNDGTTLSAYISSNGYTWLLMGTDTVGSFLTPDQIAFNAIGRYSEHNFSLRSWIEI